MIEIRLPKPGPEIENATITRWESSEGDTIQIGDILAIIKTPIGSFKVAAEEQGILDSILQPVGSSIDFDEPIAMMRPDLKIADFPNIEDQEDQTIPLPIEEQAHETTSSELSETLTTEEPAPNTPIDGSDTALKLDPSTAPKEEFDEDILSPEDEDIANDSRDSDERDPDSIRWDLSDDENGIESTEDESDGLASGENESISITNTDETEASPLKLADDEESETAIPAAPAELNISPAALKMAERLNIDLSTIQGTGDGGKILYFDVENAINENNGDGSIEQQSTSEIEPIAEIYSSPEEVSSTGNELAPEVETEANSNEVSEIESDDETSGDIETPVLEEEIEVVDDPELSTLSEEEDHEPVGNEPAPSNEHEETAPDPEIFDKEENDDDDDVQSFDENESAAEPLTLGTESSETADEEALDENEQSQASEPIATVEEEAPSEAIETDVTVPVAPLEFEPKLAISDQPFSADTASNQTPDEIDLGSLNGPFPDYDEISAQFHLSQKDDLIIPFNSNKKEISEALTKSARDIPHYYLYTDIDFTHGLKWLESQNSKSGVDLSITDLIVKATGQALAMMPEMNAFVRNDRIILKRSINIGVTTPVDEGVVAPVVPDVYHKSLQKVSETVKKNTSLATTTKVVLDYDATFTITAMPDSGVKQIIPLITPPQTGCLAVGEIQKKVVPVDDFIGIRSIMEVTLACDYRAIDPQNAAKFLGSIRESLESLRIGEDSDWIEGNEQMSLI